MNELTCPFYLCDFFCLPGSWHQSVPCKETVHKQTQIESLLILTTSRTVVVVISPWRRKKKTSFELFIKSPTPITAHHETWCCVWRQPYRQLFFFSIITKKWDYPKRIKSIPFLKWWWSNLVLCWNDSIVISFTRVRTASECPLIEECDMSSCVASRKDAKKKSLPRIPHYPQCLISMRTRNAQVFWNGYIHLNARKNALFCFVRTANGA